MKQPLKKSQLNDHSILSSIRQPFNDVSTNEKKLKQPPKKSQFGGHLILRNIRQPLDVFHNKFLKK
jgi:hypothetical protein